jgi:hypothetical protein
VASFLVSHYGLLNDKKDQQEWLVRHILSSL